MNVDRAVRRLFVASDKGCTIPYSAEESVLRELKKELIKILEEDGIELEQKKKHSLIGRKEESETDIRNICVRKREQLA